MVFDIYRFDDLSLESYIQAWQRCLEPIVDSQGEWKDAKDDLYQNGYFQGREDALNEVLDLFEKEKEVETNE